jgi:hypothetical protein
LDPARASRKFNEQKMMQDPAEARKELEELKAANRLGKVQEVDEDLEKIKQKRLEERRLREEQWVGEAFDELFDVTMSFLQSFDGRKG